MKVLLEAGTETSRTFVSSSAAEIIPNCKLHFYEYFNFNSTLKEIDFSFKAENTVIVEIRKCKCPCVVECAPLNTDHVTFVNIWFEILENSFGPYLDLGKLFIYGDFPRARGGLWSDWIDRNWQDLVSIWLLDHSPPFYNGLRRPEAPVLPHWRPASRLKYFDTLRVPQLIHYTTDNIKYPSK